MHKDGPQPTGHRAAHGTMRGTKRAHSHHTRARHKDATQRTRGAWHKTRALTAHAGTTRRRLVSTEINSKWV